MTESLRNYIIYYWKYSLKLKIVSKLEKTKGESVYGHLGLKKVQIIPYQIELFGKHKIDIEDYKVY